MMKTLNLKMLEVRLNEYLHCIYIQDQLHFLSLLFDRSNFKRFLVVASSYIFTIFCRFVCLSIVPKLTISVVEVSLGYCISLVYTPYTPNLFCEERSYISIVINKNVTCHMQWVFRYPRISRNSRLLSKANISRKIRIKHLRNNVYLFQNHPT